MWHDGRKPCATTVKSGRIIADKRAIRFLRGSSEPRKGASRSVRNEIVLLASATTRVASVGHGPETANFHIKWVGHEVIREMSTKNIDPLDEEIVCNGQRATLSCEKKIPNADVP